MSSTYSPQSQGLVERMDGILKKGLSKYKAKTNCNWEELLVNIVATYNSTPIAHFENKSPFFLVHGYNKTTKIEKDLDIRSGENQSREEEIENVQKEREKIPELILKNASKNKK